MGFRCEPTQRMNVQRQHLFSGARRGGNPTGGVAARYRSPINSPLAWQGPPRDKGVPCGARRGRPCDPQRLPFVLHAAADRRQRAVAAFVVRAEKCKSGWCADRRKHGQLDCSIRVHAVERSRRRAPKPFAVLREHRADQTRYHHHDIRVSPRQASSVPLGRASEPAGRDHYSSTQKNAMPTPASCRGPGSPEALPVCANQSSRPACETCCRGSFGRATSPFRIRASTPSR